MSRPMSEVPPCLEAALNHAAARRPVFPCSSKDKGPAIPKALGGRGFKDATTDAERIREWWAQYPKAIVGMPTGAKVGIWVLDIDVKAGQLGEETLSQLEDTFGKLPETVEALTPSGGRHLYFRHPRDGRKIPNRASQLGQGHETWGLGGYPKVSFETNEAGRLLVPGLDVRGDGGYVILPGSVMADRRSYEWEASSDPENGGSVADAPDWLLALVAVDRKPNRPAFRMQGDSTAKVGEGGRNEFLYRLGCSLRTKNLGHESIEAALLVENAARCDPPLPDEEVRKTAASAASKAAGLSPEYERKRGKRAESRAAKPDPPKYERKRAESRADSPDLQVVGGTAHDTRPLIRVKAGALPQVVDSAEQALLKAEDKDIFQHGSRLVRVGRWEGAVGPVTRPTGAGVLIDISSEWLVERMTRTCRWERFDKRVAKWLPCDAPTRSANTLLARSGEWRFAHLVGFSDSPTLDLSGRVVSKRGFDEASGLYLSAPPEIEPIETTSREAAIRAAGMLYELVSTFPFVSADDRSAVLALMMTALLRRVLPSSPIGCISASTPGTGKSLLADCISALATGRTASVAALGRDNEELEKRIDAMLLKGDAIVCWDNVDRAVKSDVLCQVSTQTYKSVRVLAQSRIVEAPTNVTMLMTGNNLTLLGDLTRRVLLVHMDAGCERPELRSFQRDAIAHVLQFRAEGIRNALMVSKAYIDAGCPDVGARPFGSFEQWDRMIRRPLMWAGQPDPLGPAEGMREQDHEFAGMSELFEAWLETLGPNGRTAAEVYEAIIAREPGIGKDWVPKYPRLLEAAVAVMGAPSKWGARELGYRFRAWTERIIDGRRLLAGKKGSRGVMWRVDTIQW